MYRLIRILEESVEKNGEKPLTNKWLLNILKMWERRKELDAQHLDAIEARFNRRGY